VDKAIKIANRMQNSLTTMVQKRKQHISDEPELKQARPNPAGAQKAAISSRSKLLQQLEKKSVAEIAAKLDRCPKCLFNNKHHDAKPCAPQHLEKRLDWIKSFLVDGREVTLKFPLFKNQK
jgi:hypothetical protein